MNTVKIACIIMASGYSTRFGSNKLLAKLNNKPLASYTLKRCSQLDIPVVVVTRYAEIAAIAKQLEIPALVHNFPYQNDTIRLGLEYFRKHGDFDGYMFCTCDQPFLETTTVQKLCQEFQANPNNIYRLANKETPGNPVIFPASLREQLLDIPQDKGGSYVVQQNSQLIKLINVENQLELLDIDTPKDLEIANKYKRSV